MDGERRDVSFVEVTHESAVADEGASVVGDQVVPCAALRELAEEQRGTPRARVDEALDPEDVAHVPPTHGRERYLRGDAPWLDRRSRHQSRTPSFPPSP